MSDIQTEQNTEREKSEISAPIVIIDPQKQRPNSQKDALGRFLPGNCANPGGRPKTKHVSEAYRAILDEHGADELAQVVYKDAIHAGKASDRLAAVQEITDRVEGKAVQSHRLSTDGVDAQTARMLVELASRIVPQVNILVTNRPLTVTEESSESEQLNQSLTDGGTHG